MKRKNLFAAIGVAVLGGVLLASCVEKNYYNTYPNNNNSGSYTYVFDEEFNGSDNYGWDFTDATDSVYASISNGSYQYVDYSTTASNATVVNTGANVSGNFSVQTRIQSNNTMGLIIGASSYSNGYAFYIDSLGNYSLYKEGYGSTASTVVISATADSNIVKKGWNTMEIDQASGNWTGYINGSQVFQIVAPSVSGASFGFKVLPLTIGYADYLIVKSY